MEVRARHDGFCDPLATDTVEAWRGMGDSGPAHEVGTFSNHVNDLHTGEILPVVHLRDCPAACSASVHSIR